MDGKRFNGKGLRLEFNGMSIDVDEIEFTAPEAPSKGTEKMAGIVDGSATLKFEAAESLPPELGGQIDVSAPVKYGRFGELVLAAIGKAQAHGHKPIQLLATERLIAGLLEESIKPLYDAFVGDIPMDVKGEFCGIPYELAELTNELIGMLMLDNHQRLHIRDKDHWKWTDEEADAELRYILASHHAAKCPSCDREIDRGDVSWNSPSTEAGTSYCVLQITCQNCGTEILHQQSWYPGIDGFNEFVYVLGDNWGDE